MKKDISIIIRKPGVWRSGVYIILNPLKNKVYIGETTDFGRRMVEHINSIYGFENSSNENIIAEENESRSYLMFVALEHQYNKNTSEELSWITDETIYMYLFRKNGFQLYNGNKYNRDNMGYQRSFLHQKNVIYEELSEFLGVNMPPKSYIDEKENQLNETFLEMFGIRMQEWVQLNDKERLRIWENAMNELGKDNFLIKNKSSKKEVCRQLRKINLNKYSLRECGLKEKSLLELAENGCLDRIVVSKFGNYYEQSPMTILMTKQFDILHNRMKTGSIVIERKNNPDEGDGICFWALRNLNPDTVKTFLTDTKGNGQYTGPRYAILAYTMSGKFKKKHSEIDFSRYLNKWEGETLTAFFERMRLYYECSENKLREIARDEKELDILTKIAKYNFAFRYGFKLQTKTKRVCYDYPSNAFPEVVSKSGKRNYAFLISELCYAKEAFDDINDFYGLYNSRTGNELIGSFGGQNSHSCAEVKDRDNLVEWLENISKAENTEMTGCIIAKLQYPYMVELEVTR